jgi:hypothetical protein
VRQIGVRFRSGGSSQLDGHSFLSLLQGAQFLHHRGTALDESQEIADLPAELGLLLQRQRSLPGAALAVGSVYLSHIGPDEFSHQARRHQPALEAHQHPLAH